MKKIYLMLVVVLGVVFITGCGDKSVSDGKSIQFSLKNNSSAGYQWNYKITDEDIIEVERDYESDCAGDGCGGKEIYTVKGKKAGKTKMILKHCYHPESRCETEITYEFVVDKDLNISEKHTEKTLK